MPRYKKRKKNKNFEIFPALHSASEHGHVGIVEILVSSKSVNVEDLYKSTPLHEAAKHGYVEIVEILTKGGANVNATDIYGCTPLYEANENNHTGVITFLESRRASMAIGNCKRCLLSYEPLDIVIEEEEDFE